mmetsp:Transcript_11981/g.15624  ORF Transcript_11981/g.15624 Transcript_11981/m.15624 type:complete len:171 (+) Transcript_11981:345-857(+)|eukprot:CAMPEP_0116058716 /NCGR_PEP_ID=MMETSP0322-20121206/5367_1 /TAXON_ID=163516 /ORGANISM="Leptocylindrus danicus var. apora, Strain B651" /LENGTH=170 /DNA_ID=CAMNT_0003542961 /DNA_START=122 /DNA_END=634 /DNA_ORIENTATION=+
MKTFTLGIYFLTIFSVAALNSPKKVERRTFLRNAFASIVVGTTIMGENVRPAEATYSAYTAREQDWEARKKSGDVKYSSARDLKSQLREIAPMNAKGEIFCPNGPSANVTPMMENKCGDRLAMPSVYGRTEDIVGNSIPGFSKDYNFGSPTLTGSQTSFPEYEKTPGKRR